MARLDDLTGRRFGKWRVLSRLPSAGHNTVWKCVCDCGNEAAVQAGSLIRGGSTRCTRCRTAKLRKG